MLVNVNYKINANMYIVKLSILYIFDAIRRMPWRNNLVINQSINLSYFSNN